MGTCKGIIRKVDPDIRLENIRYTMRPSFNIIDIIRLTRKLIEDNGFHCKSLSHKANNKDCPELIMIINNEKKKE